MTIKHSFYPSFFILIILLSSYNSARAQKIGKVKSAMDSAARVSKPLIDSNAYKQWMSLGWGTSVSNDGKYVFYTIQNKPIGKNTLVIQEIDNGWKREIETPNGPFSLFTPDCKRLIVPLANDSLAIVVLGSDQMTYLTAVRSFKLSDNNWLAYQTTLNNDLILHNLSSKEKKQFADVQEYLFSKNNLLFVSKTEDSLSNAFNIFNRTNNSLKTIYKGGAVQSIILNAGNDKIAFIESIANDKSIWIFKTGDAFATKINSQALNYNPDSLYIEGLTGFTQDDSQIIVSLKKIPIPTSEPKADVVTVWSYSDAKLQSQQLKELQQTLSYTALLEVSNETLTRIEGVNERIDQSAFNEHLGEVMLISHIAGDAGIDEQNWNKAAELTWYLYTSKNKKRVELQRVKNYVSGTIKISPDGAFVVYFNPDTDNFISYNVITGSYVNVTDNISTSWLEVNRNDLPNADHTPRGVAGWLKKQHAMLAYDQYDIWLIDLAGKKKPMNMTNGYGLSNHTRFSIEPFESSGDYSDQHDLILNGFNPVNKENGYFRKTLNKTGDPERLTMGPYLYNIVNNPYVPNAIFSAIKAKERELYVVRRMNEKESPNLFSTPDFKTFTPLSHIHPEKEYNWLTAELRAWQLPNGKTSQGILYKPENFDPAKKYPVIFWYYERKSDGLHCFQQPQNLIGGCNIDIATYVSNGYLVFMPDIYYTVGDPMQGTYDAVVSAAASVLKLSFVDPARLGLQGCSWGGIQTNHLITRTNLFTAALSASSVADFVSVVGGIRGDGSALRGVYELGQPRMGYSLWEQPDLYIKNSAIFSADKVTTPLLMMQTKDDGICPFPNALEFFTSLRRLGKKAWLLEYREGNHAVHGGSAIDFSIRARQFFDHYLMGQPAPKWMTQGLPAALKGIDDRLELDIPTAVP